MKPVKKLLPGRILIPFFAVCAAVHRGYGQPVTCQLPEAKRVAVHEPFVLDPLCEREPGRAYQYQWNPGDGSGDLPWADSARLAFAYSEPSIHVAILRVRVDGDWQPANTFSVSVTVVSPVTSSPPVHSTTLLYDSARQEVWNVNHDNGSITGTHAGTLARIREIRVGKKPGNLALDRGGFLWVTVASPASLVKVSGNSGSVISSIPLPRGSLPHGLVIDVPRDLAYVALEGTGKIFKLDLASLSITGEVDVFPTPRALALSHDGKRLLVARFHTDVRHHLPPDSSVAEIFELSAESMKVTHRIHLPYDQTLDSRLGGSGVLTLLRSLVIHPDGKRAWVAAVKANVFRGRVRSGVDFDPNGENSLRAVIAVIDLETRREVQASRFDLDNMAMPSAIAFTRDGVHGFAAMQGTNAIQFLNGHDLTEAGTIGPFSFGPEMAPDGLVLSPSDSLLFVHNFTTRSLGVYDRTRTGPTGGFHPLKTVPLVAEDALNGQQLRGLQVFYNSADPRITKSGYINCAVCHIGGGSDRLVWDFTQRGEGLRKTIPLTGRAGMEHGPVHWSANFDEIQDFEHDIRGPFAGTGLMDDALFLQGIRNQTLGDRKAGHSPDLDALAAYVSSLAVFEPSPFRNPDGSLTEDALKGRAIFRREEVGCFRCHSAPDFTDSRLPVPGTPFTPGPVSIFGGASSHYTKEGFLLHDVGTLRATSGKRMNDTLKGLDTPTLKGIWQYPPYLHDGSAATLMEVITTRNPEDRHGRTSHLSLGEKKQLIEFLLQIDDASDNATPVEPRRGKGKKPHAVTFSRWGGGWKMEIGLKGNEGISRVEFFDLAGHLHAYVQPRRQGSGYQALLPPGVVAAGKNHGGILVYRVNIGEKAHFTGKAFLH